MCLAVPVKVVELLDMDMVRCQVGDSDTFVNASTALIADELQPGDYIIVHAGFALRKLDGADAEETLRLLREMVEVVEADRGCLA